MRQTFTRSGQNCGCIVQGDKRKNKGNGRKGSKHRKSTSCSISKHDRCRQDIHIVKKRKMDCPKPRAVLKENVLKRWTLDKQKKMRQGKKTTHMEEKPQEFKKWTSFSLPSHFEHNFIHHLSRKIRDQEAVQGVWEVHENIWKHQKSTQHHHIVINHAKTSQVLGQVFMNYKYIEWRDRGRGKWRREEYGEGAADEERKDGKIKFPITHQITSGQKINQKVFVEHIFQDEVCFPNRNVL